jgi:hypothetical protein
MKLKSSFTFSALFLAFGAALLLCAGRAIAQTPPPEPACAEDAVALPNSTTLDVYVRRQDFQRALDLLVAAGKAVDDCASQFSANDSNDDMRKFNLLKSAATSFSQAADLAFALKEYDLVRSSVTSANAIYAQMMASPPPHKGYEIDWSTEKAMVQANLDLLARLPAR